jgi:antitoxin component YwqK of YwqJK toxin-antitoxin module
MLRTGRTLLVGAALLSCGGAISLSQTTHHAQTPTHPQTSTHYYRYELNTRIGDNDYRDEIPAPAHPGPSYKVVRDQLGRIVEETDLRDGKPTGVWKYQYSGTGRLPIGYETWINGEHTETTQITRNSDGIIIRYDEHTADGDPTGYTKIQDFGDRQESIHFDTDDKPTYHSVTWYAPGSGYLIRRISYASATSDQVYTDVTMDEHTGHALSSKQMDGNTLQNTKKWVWSADDELLRVDVYDDKGVWFSADEFDHGLSSRRLYKFTDGGSKEIRYAYNEKRWLVKSTMYYNDKLICTISYNRLPDGSVKNTVAVAPDGMLMAEYPPPIVMDIGRNGQPPGRNDGVLHKTGDWW